jgi:two-component system LytT family response regulator
MLVMDDDRATCARLRSLVTDVPDIELIDECADDRHALKLIERVTPELIVSRTPLPESLEIEVGQRIASGRTAVVLLADSEKYAVHAFELGAADYVLKPFTDERFGRALNRVRRQLASPSRTSSARPPVADRAPYGSDVHQRVMIKSGGRVYLLRCADIHWCEAVGNYVRVHAEDETYQMRSTLALFEKQLDAAQFTRVHRSTIVNVDFVREFRATPNGDYAITLRDDTHLTLSRGFREAFERTLTGPLRS